MISEVTVNLGVVGATCLLLVFYLFKFVYRYKHQYESNPLCTFAVIFCLIVVLLITCILPIDIFLVSFIKNQDGSFKDWAKNETLIKIDKIVFDAYYTLYGLVIVLIFLVIPFLHFFNDETNSSSQGRLNTAIKYTFMFLLLMIMFLFVGAFLYSENHVSNPVFDNIIPSKDVTKFQSAIVFVLTLITTLGFINVCFYTASGIFSWPIGLFQGTSSVTSRYDSVKDRADLLRLKIASLKQKARVEQLSQQEQSQLDETEEELRQLDQEEAILGEHRNTWTYKLRKAIRPVQMVLGLLFGAVSLTILATLIIVNTDRLLNGGGFKDAYILLKPTIFNPLEYVFTKSQDLIFFGPMPLLLTLCFMVVATISGARNLGLWLVVVRLHRLKVGRTQPQALLFFCITMMLAAIAFNMLFFSMASQYVTFGNQNYQKQSGNATIVAACTIADYHKDCVLTRTSVLLMQMMTNLWIFGVLFYWSSWIFVAIATVSMAAYMYRGKRRAAHDLILDNEEFQE